MTVAAPRPARALETLWSPWQTALLVGGGLLVLSELLVPGAAGPFPGHGERFVEMAQDPVSYTHLTLPTICSV